MDNVVYAKFSKNNGFTRQVKGGADVIPLPLTETPQFPVLYTEKPVVEYEELNPDIQAYVNWIVQSILSGKVSYAAPIPLNIPSGATYTVRRRVESALLSTHTVSLVQLRDIEDDVRIYNHALTEWYLIIQEKKARQK